VRSAPAASREDLPRELISCLSALRPQLSLRIGSGPSSPARWQWGSTRNQRTLKPREWSNSRPRHIRAHQSTSGHGRARSPLSSHGRRGRAESNDISAWSWGGTVGIVPRWCSIGVVAAWSVIGWSVPYGSVELPDGLQPRSSVCFCIRRASIRPLCPVV
jgi:hypothetical protein